MSTVTGASGVPYLFRRYDAGLQRAPSGTTPTSCRAPDSVSPGGGAEIAGSAGPSG